MRHQHADADSDADASIYVGYRDEAPGSNFTETTADQCIGTPVVVSEPLHVTALGFSLRGQLSSDKFLMAMYDDVGGDPGSLLASVEDATGVVGFAATPSTHRLAEAVDVEAGDVWLVVCNESYDQLGAIEDSSTVVMESINFEDGAPTELTSTAQTGRAIPLLWLVGALIP